MYLPVERMNWIWTVSFWTFLFVLKWWRICMPFIFVVLSNNVMWVKYFNNVQNAVSDKHCWKLTDDFEMVLSWWKNNARSLLILKIFLPSKALPCVVRTEINATGMLQKGGEEKYPLCSQNAAMNCIQLATIKMAKSMHFKHSISVYRIFTLVFIGFYKTEDTFTVSHGSMLQLHFF